MNALPLLEELVPLLDHHRHQSPHLAAFDPDAEYNLRRSIPSKQIDLRVPRSGYVDVGGFVILRVDHESETQRAMD
jgi:hypothetical protein